MDTKHCFKCLTVKGIDAFYKHVAMKDGRLNKCIECTKNDAKIHRVNNIERIRSYDRMRGSIPQRVEARRRYALTSAYAASHSLAIKRWGQKHPERKAASTAVANAIRDGRLQKQPCHICGGAAQAHYPDYSHPLDVVWLCAAHHKQAHQLANEINRAENLNISKSNHANITLQSC